MTLRELIIKSNLNDVYPKLLVIENENHIDKDSLYSIGDVKKIYGKVIDTLLDKSHNSAKTVYSKMPIYVRYEKSPIVKESYIEVSRYNDNYKEPPKNLKWWGGEWNIEDDAPEGHYNINCDCYSKYFSLGYEWEEFIDSEIINEDHLGNELLLAEILYSITFDGYTEEDQREFHEEMMRRIEDMDNGNTGYKIYNNAEDMMKDLFGDDYKDKLRDAGDDYFEGDDYYK